MNTYNHSYNRTRNHITPDMIPEIIGKIMAAISFIFLTWVFLSFLEIAFADPLTVKNQGVENTYSEWNIFCIWITNR